MKNLFKMKFSNCLVMLVMIGMVQGCREDFECIAIYPDDYYSYNFELIGSHSTMFSVPLRFEQSSSNIEKSIIDTITVELYDGELLKSVRPLGNWYTIKKEGDSLFVYRNAELVAYGLAPSGGLNLREKPDTVISSFFPIRAVLILESYKSFKLFFKGGHPNYTNKLENYWDGIRDPLGWGADEEELIKYGFWSQLSEDELRLTIDPGFRYYSSYLIPEGETIQLSIIPVTIGDVLDEEFNLLFTTETDTKYYLEYYEESEVEVDGEIYRAVFKMRFLWDVFSSYDEDPCDSRPGVGGFGGCCAGF